MLPLSLVKAGEESTIKKVGGVGETRKYLENLGFVTGGNIKVVTENGGGVIVMIKESRIAISKEMASKILV